MTMQSGFAAGTPRSDNYKGVRERKERGSWLPRIMGIGGTGKAPAPIPVEMLKALGVINQTEDDTESQPKEESPGLPRTGTSTRQPPEQREDLEPVPTYQHESGARSVDLRQSNPFHSSSSRASASFLPRTSQQERPENGEPEKLLSYCL